MKKILFIALLLSLAATARAEFSDCHERSSGLFQDPIYVCLQTTKLKALKDRTTVHGEFSVFLLVGGGELRENWIVRFAKEDEQGFTQLREIGYGQVRIKEGDWKEPIVKKWVMVQNGKIYSEDLPPFDDSDHGYFFFVPKGTIETQYKVDMK